VALVVLAATVPDPAESRLAVRPHTARAVAGYLHAEHHAALALVPIEEATHVAARSGDWSAAATWRGGRVPGPGARVFIPAATRVTVSTTLPDVYEWVRVDGALRLAHDRDTALKLGTLVVADRGRFDVGFADRRVEPGCRALIEFAGRGPRDTRRDPLDLGGGLVAQGLVRVFGAAKSGHVLLADAAAAGSSSLRVREPPRGWRAGDLVLLPGTNPLADEDEVVPIERLEAGGRWVVLGKPLRFAHQAPAGADLPLGNLTRNVVFRSAHAEPRQGRGHVMVMHVTTGVVFDGAAFVGLGRTDTRVAHTVPALDADGRLVPGTDANTIGRYAVHFHVRRGATRRRPPNVIVDSVVVDSPKHGIVNHGGYLHAVGNVTWRVDGSHYFAENGTEIGAFSHNLAVRSGGSALSRQDDGLMSRMYVRDFGHGGYGYWLQGAGVALHDNYAFGQAAAGYAINGHPMLEGGDWAFFSPRNVTDPRIPARKDLQPGDLPFEFRRNQAGACFNGLDIWYSQIHLAHEVPSVVEDSFFWGIERHGVSLPYTRHVTFRNVTVLGNGRDGTSYGFGNANDRADALTFENVRAEGFAIGIDLPKKGVNRIHGARLANVENIRVRNGPGHYLDLEMRDVEFAPSSVLDVRLDGSPALTRDVLDGTTSFGRLVPRNADLSSLFGRVKITLARRGERRPRQLYFREQARHARPYDALGIPALAGLTTREAWTAYGLAVGGAMAPPDAVAEPRITGLVGRQDGHGAGWRLVSDHFTRTLRGYVPRVRHEATQAVAEGAPVDLQPGWNVVRWRRGKPAVLVYGDVEAPRFQPDPEFTSQIHPADLRFGVTVRGALLDKVGALYSRELFVKEYAALVPDPDGVVRLQFPVQDPAGNVSDVHLALQVTERAVQRGANSVYYRQGVYSPADAPGRTASTAY
jgi:hypothetical protein